MSARWRAAVGTACAALALAAASCSTAAAGTQTARETASVQTRGVVIDAAHLAARERAAFMPLRERYLIYRDTRTGETPGAAKPTVDATPP
jgi:hypothetical protein